VFQAERDGDGAVLTFASGRVHSQVPLAHLLPVKKREPTAKKRVPKKSVELAVGAL